MKKITKFFVATLLSLSFVLPLAACGGHKHADTNGDGFCDSCEEPMPPVEPNIPDEPVGDTDLLPENIIEDSYDNYYQIMPASFCDSNNDNFGDLDGITSKLDYIRDLGYTGIWLTPIMPTDSYHGYDVTDYKGINPKLGTMEDFDELIEKAHSLGIKVIIDLVLNHSSNHHTWFQTAIQAIKMGITANKYCSYYNFSTSSRSGYADYGSDGKGGHIYAEAQFSSSMPDLNLDSQDLRADIKDIIEFWIKDEKVDGFRLDAAKHFYNYDTERNSEFMAWVQDTSNAAMREETGNQNAKAFLVGEVWDSQYMISQFFEKSHGANFFDFSASGPSGYICNAVTSAMGGAASSALTSYFNSVNTVISTASGNTPCPFLDNHDISRISNALLKQEARVKFAYGHLSLYSGSNFTYYGDEIGMAGAKEQGGDCEMRVGIQWTKSTKMLAPGGAAQRNDPTNYYPFGSVEEQLADKNSIVNYYKLCNNARNAFPALMRGTPTRGSTSNSNVLVMTKTYQGKSVTVVVNFSASQQTVTGLSDTLKLKQGICVSGSVSGTASSLNVPGFGIAILA